LNIRPLRSESASVIRLIGPQSRENLSTNQQRQLKRRDHLIMEVMALRDYPVSDFEQRAADISVKYPALVTNYRARRGKSRSKNKNHKASTEELRQALIYYRSLFDELLKGETVVPEKN